MAEPTIADLLKELKTMSTEISALKTNVASIKEKASTDESSENRRPEGPCEQDFHPKHKKWDFPHFDGTTDPMLFLNKCEAYFRQHRTMAEERVRMASYHLDDAAQLWFIQLQEDEGTPTWVNFKDLVNLRFGPPLRSAPMFELAECCRTGTMEEYANRFQALLPRAGRLDEAQRVQLFTCGLRPPLSNTVHLHNLDSLAAAISLARQVELMELERPTPVPPRAPPCGLPAPAARAALPPPPPLLALPAPGAAAQPGHVEGNQRRLTPEEMADRRRQGLCFNCNEKYSRGHNRFCRRLLFLEGVEIDDAIVEGTDAAADIVAREARIFSLHAVAGVSVGRTMQVRVLVGSTPLVALLDTGSTHNFIAETAAARSGLPIQSQPRLTAIVANGEKVPCPGVIRHAPIVIHDAAFTVDLFVMPLAGHDLVLGTQWMATLGRLVWDFVDGSVSFQR